MSRFRYSTLTSLVVVTALASVATAGNWPGWRGPTFNGVAPEGDYPIEWGADKNIAWKFELPGKAGSTPIVWENRIFVTAPGDESNQVFCLDRSGRQLWKTIVGSERPGKHKKASGANPSAATDGQHVFVYFKSGDLACLDYAGKIVWQKNLQDMYGEDTLWWDLGTSPVLTRKNVVVACMQTGPSYLAAFDKTTGRVAWKHDRNLGAPEEAAQSYSTPVVVKEGGRETLVVVGADHVTANDAADGRELWRVGGLNPTGHKYFRSISSVVVADGLVIAPYARGDSITAVRLGGQGDVTDSHVEWTRTGVGADVPTPIAIHGRLYVCGDKGEVTCLDLKTGETLWSERVAKNRNAFSSSPILAGGHIYATREDGTTFVVKAGEKFEVVASNSLGEFTVASPVFADGQILIQTADSLYCIGRGN